MADFIQQDTGVWEPYYHDTTTAAASNNGKGKGKGHPITPEPATYGVVLVGLCLVVMMARRWRSNR